MDIKKRLNLIIQKDKSTNTQYLINVIKSDFYYMISNYFEVDFDDVEVNISSDKDKYIIQIRSLGDRMKTMRSMPE